MPRQGQIIPKWLHPHEETFINDNTKFTETTDDNPGVRFLNVFTGPKGIDNKLLLKKSFSKWVDEYGLPDYRLYGQPIYMPYVSLSTLYAQSWSMRVMPENATYSNAIIVAMIKADNTEPTNVKLRVKFKALTQTGLNDASMLETYMETLKSTTPDTDGYISYPIMGFWSLGRGVYGDYYRIRVSNDTGANKVNNYMNYKVELISTENSTTKRLESHNCCFYIDAQDPDTGITLFANEVVDDYEGDGSKRVNMLLFHEYIEEIFEFYKTNVDPTTTLTVENFDIFGYDVTTGADNTKIVIDGGASSVAILSNSGVKLSSGDDGSLAFVNSNSAARADAIEKLYMNAYTGSIDPKILSKVRAPIDIMLDANLPVSAKKAMASLAITRGDSFCHIDSGLLTTVSDVETFAKTLNDIDTFMVSKDAGMYKTKDPITNKIIPVTITLWLAYKYPNHYRTRGNHVPLAGEDYAKLSGYEKNSIRPLIDADDHDIKEVLYTDLRWNYIECIGENIYIRGTQSTCQLEWSDLSETSNVLVLLEIKRRLEYETAKKRYKFSEASDRRLFTESAKEIFSGYVGNKIKSLNIEFKMSAWEETRSILHCYAAIVFKTITKRSLIEIDVNPRV